MRNKFTLNYPALIAFVGLLACVLYVAFVVAAPDNVGLVNNCLMIGVGPDEDAEIMAVNVTGSPMFAWDESEDSFTMTHPVVITGIADGGLTNYDLNVGGETYGMIQFGNAVIGKTNFKAGDVDLDGTVVFRNIGGPITGNIEFIWTESGGSTRFALPASGPGNATYNPRSLLVIGPAPEHDGMVEVSYWQGLSWFDNIDCDTAGTGADLGVQDDLEVEGTIFTDDIQESTSGAGVSFTGLVIPSGTTPGPDVEGAIFLDSDESANGSLMIYSNGSWRKNRDL